MIRFLNKEVMIMATKLSWETEMNKALDRAKKENRQVLLDFFNPG